MAGQSYKWTRCGTSIVNSRSIQPTPSNEFVTTKTGLNHLGYKKRALLRQTITISDFYTPQITVWMSPVVFKITSLLSVAAFFCLHTIQGGRGRKDGLVRKTSVHYRRERRSIRSILPVFLPRSLDMTGTHVELLGAGCWPMKLWSPVREHWHFANTRGSLTALTAGGVRLSLMIISW